MLEMLRRWLIQQPAHILLIAAVNLALWAACRVTVLRTVPKSNVLWVPAVGWLAYAGWEWLVLLKSTEANIRVDLLLIWPFIGLVTLWAFVRAAGGRSADTAGSSENVQAGRSPCERRLVLRFAHGLAVPVIAQASARSSVVANVGFSHGAAGGFGSLPGVCRPSLHDRNQSVPAARPAPAYVSRWP